MTYDEAKAIRDRKEQELKDASEALKVFPKLPNGLTPDDIKSTQEFKNARAEYNLAFTEVRKFNAFFVKEFKKEIREEKRNKEIK